MQLSNMTKLSAFLSHLGISFLLFIIILYIIIFHWYPEPFFTSDGGWQGIRIIAAVDLVLGPLLTLIVFKPGKKGLKMDLTIIGIIQVAALSWGIWIVHYERPIAAVYAENLFSTVTANDFKNQGLDGDKLKKYGDTTPVWIYSNLPEDFEALQEVRLQALQLGRPLHWFVEYYRPIDQVAINRINKKPFNIKEWIKDKPKDLAVYEKFLEDNKEKRGQLLFIPWHARYERSFIVMQSENLEYFGNLDIAPPKAKEEKVEYK